MPLDPTQLPLPNSKYKPQKISAYRTVGNTELKAHIFFPKDLSRANRRPAFVFFHPGGWTMGDPAWGYDICHRYASCDMVAISFQYRLSSIGGFTPVEAVSDAMCAIRWTRRHADELGTDPKRLVASGVSSGGHLAACAAMLTGSDDLDDSLIFNPVPNALVLQCPCVNPVIDSHFVELLQGMGKAENYSPTHHVRTGLPPMCLIHGTADEIVSYDSVKQFAAKMREAGNRCELHTLEGTDHFFVRKSDQDKAMALIDNFLFDLGYIKRGPTKT
jgi:acetyl esterase